MSVEFIGYIGSNLGSEIIPRQGPEIDIAHIEAATRIHEEGGFDRALVAFNSASAESQHIAAYAATVTRRLQFMIAHRPGFTAPTLAARQLATLDQLSGGRMAVHIITGGADDEMRKDGDHLTKDDRYARASEYLDVLVREWTEAAPFDYAGKYYSLQKASSTVKPVQQPHIPIYFGGSSDAAIAVAGKHADVYALWGETLDQVREIIARVRAAAAKHGRQPRFSLSLRPVIADTEEAAWKRADEIVEQAREQRVKAGLPVEGHRPPNAGSQRLLDAVKLGTRLDKRLWTGVAAVTGAAGNSTGLVGTPEQVAEALLDYHDIGVSTFLIRGFDPLNDAVAYGRDLIPLTRQLVQARAKQPVAIAV